MSIATKLLAACACPLAAVALSACGEATAGGVGGSAKASVTRTTGERPAGGAGSAVGSRGSVQEVADPTEASAYPVVGPVHHAAAKTPAKAGAIVAAGALSDEEVKRELEQMHAIQRSAKQSQRNRLAPVAGGRSIGGDGTLPIPTNVPEVIQKVVAGANEIANFPYVFGGGHASFVDNAYDCSGSVSYALAAGGLLNAPETSGALESWGVPGPGKYITVYANAGHTYMYIDGVQYNTAGRSGTYASRWLVGGSDNTGYVVRHYPGL